MHNGNDSTILPFLNKWSSASHHKCSGSFIVMIFCVLFFIYIIFLSKAKQASFKPFLCALLLSKNTISTLRAVDDTLF